MSNHFIIKTAVRPLRELQNALDYITNEAAVDAGGPVNVVSHQVQPLGDGAVLLFTVIFSPAK